MTAPSDGTVMGFIDETPEEAVFQALGRASACWENLEGAGVFDSTTAKKVGDELLAFLAVVESNTEVGNWVTITLATNPLRTIYGKLVAVFSGEGRTDGLLHVLIEGDERPTNVYERHIVMLYRHPRPATATSAKGPE